MLPVGAWIMALTVSLVLAPTDPAHAMAIYPTADALARTAELELKDASSDTRERQQAKSEALRSLIHAPANPRATAVLAVAAANAGEARRSEQLLHYSELMSRRHLPSQLILLEVTVQAGNVDAALLHYDRAMRVSLESRMILFPILVQASDNPDVLPKVTRLMTVDSSWKSSFLDRVIAGNAHPATIAALVSAARLDPHDSIGNRQLTAAIAKLVASGSYAEAEQVFRGTCTPLTCAGTPTNGHFERQNPLPPFGWELLDDQTEIMPVSPRNHVLGFSGWSGGPGARQLLRLSAGRYVIHGTFGIPSSASAITLTLRCTASGTAFSTLSATVSGRQTSDFLVPTGCRYQWLTLSQAPRLDRDTDPAWIDDIAIARLNAPLPTLPTDAGPFR